MAIAFETLTQKMHSLTPDQLLKVEALVESLQADDHHRAALCLSEAAFGAVWNNAEDDIYNAI